MTKTHEDLWKNANALDCPLLRFDYDRKMWISEDGKDPCPTMACKRKACHNFGKPFDEPKRFIVPEDKPFTGYDPFESVVERLNRVVRVSCPSGHMSLVKFPKSEPISHCPHCGVLLSAKDMCFPRN